MMTEEEEAAYTNEHYQNEIQEKVEVLEDNTMSLNTLCGTSDLNKLRIKGYTKGKKAQILVASGSTHCFLDEDMARKLDWKIEYTTPMLVIIGDGNKVVFSVNLTPVPHSSQNDKLEKVLHSYDDVFAKPQGLPPDRHIEHQILLITHAVPKKQAPDSDGILRHNSKICMGSANGIRDKVMQVIHDSALGGHSGIGASIQRISAYFTWPGLIKNVT
ncbi:hypothetical protein BUALT_Bualt01G0183800 [Buddleja alternifolia]|uniref:Integrase zinc-binding domain-containing protein n=1 Tax=Buddleja alternifolia TaxID=168488 RepID=A0AAV6Y859_9LAMI|nr:hypothetical protein BUALT_Bualt01G0183800 [Buddleja alternifolia]